MSLGERKQQESADGSNSSQSGEDREPAVAGSYSWADFYDDVDPAATPRADVSPSDPDCRSSSIDPMTLLGFDPSDIESELVSAVERAAHLNAATYDTFDPERTPVRQGEWTWHHMVRAYHDPEYPGLDIPEEFDRSAYLGFAPEDTEGVLSWGESAATALEPIIEERTVDIHPDIDEEEFFTSVDGSPTLVSRYDLEKAVPMAKKQHFDEIERYWVNKPYAFVVLFHSRKENEKKYYLIGPYQTPIETELLAFLTGKLRTSIKYADTLEESEESLSRREVIEQETRTLMDRYDIYDEESNGQHPFDRIRNLLGWEVADTSSESPPDGYRVRPEPALVEEDANTLTTHQVEKLLYRLKRDFLGYERIDGIKHDINVEDISCDGYNSPVFVYHTEYEQLITNVVHGKERLDEFVVKLAQRSGKGISKRQPQVDATLPDGSRAQLTLGREVSDKGTNYTIRQFNDVPFTPVDLINWRTFSLEEMAFLWLCIENHKSLIFAGGTASGKTTSLNAVSLFIPSNAKIVSIEDTREVELPQRNWIASVTRPSFSDDDKGEVDEFDLLEAALRQRPEYIVMGEIRGEEGRTLFQVMSTGHTTYTTFHADSVGEVLKRFTTAPINVSKTMFTALDLVSIQTSTRVHGHKVRRNKSLTEINHYDPENDEINVKDIYQWEAETDEFRLLGDSSTLDDILFDRGWDRERLDEELFKREVVLAYLIQNGLNEYREVAATLQAFINDPETIFTLIARDELADSLEDLREMESVLIDVDPDKEALVPRPDPDEEMLEQTTEILERANQELFPSYRDPDAGTIADALIDPDPESVIEAEPGSGTDLRTEVSEADLDDPDEDSFDTIPATADQDDPDDGSFDTVPPSEMTDRSSFDDLEG